MSNETTRTATTSDDCCGENVAGTMCRVCPRRHRKANSKAKDILSKSRIECVSSGAERFLASAQSMKHLNRIDRDAVARLGSKKFLHQVENHGGKAFFCTSVYVLSDDEAALILAALEGRND